MRDHRNVDEPVAPRRCVAVPVQHRSEALGIEMRHHTEDGGPGCPLGNDSRGLRRRTQDLVAAATGISGNAGMTGHEHYAGVLSELNPQHRALRQMIPDVYKGFGDMSRAALAAGALESKVKELTAMVIGVVLGCDGCIASHARGAVRAGASKQEAAEMIGVSIMMHGGPATIYGARAYAAFCEFADDTAGPAQE